MRCISNYYTIKLILEKLHRWSNMVDHQCEPCSNKKKTIKLVFVASTLSMHVFELTNMSTRELMFQ
jgi:hypothetical protein